ncbi:hypothetical protein HDU96_003280 [Phlyctochytrium bullatum]|nr:hypothetical protein HDU96_003280 [Phlyctochytrium bullatum]
MRGPSVTLLLLALAIPGTLSATLDRRNAQREAEECRPDESNVYTGGWDNCRVRVCRNDRYTTDGFDTEAAKKIINTGNVDNLVYIMYSRAVNEGNWRSTKGQAVARRDTSKAETMEQEGYIAKFANITQARASRAFMHPFAGPSINVGNTTDGTLEVEAAFDVGNAKATLFSYYPASNSKNQLQRRNPTRYYIRGFTWTGYAGDWKFNDRVPSYIHGSMVNSVTGNMREGGSNYFCGHIRTTYENYCTNWDRSNSLLFAVTISTTDEDIGFRDCDGNSLDWWWPSKDL